MVPLEDVAALTGLPLAVLGVGITALTDRSVWDGLGAAVPAARVIYHEPDLDRTPRG